MPADQTVTAAPYFKDDSCLFSNPHRASDSFDCAASTAICSNTDYGATDLLGRSCGYYAGNPLSCPLSGGTNQDDEESDLQVEKPSSLSEDPV